MNDRNFNPFQNLDRILWKETLQVNFLRTVCVLPVLTIALIASGVEITAILGIIIFYPILYLILGVPLLLFMKELILAIGGPFGGILVLLLIIPVTIMYISGGDPIMFFLKKIKPELIPLEKYPFISFQLAIFVLKE